MSFKIKNNNINTIIKKLGEAHYKTSVAYSRQLDDVMSNPRQWATGFGETHRKNGEVVIGSYRNIWDLGNAATSKQMDTGTPFKTTFTWDGNGETPVALVHEGGTLHTGTRIPGRPFTVAAADELNLPKTFAGYFNAT